MDKKEAKKLGFHKPMIDLNRVMKGERTQNITVSVEFEFEGIPKPFEFDHTMPVHVSSASVVHGPLSRMLSGGDKWLGEIYNVVSHQFRVYIHFEEIVREGVSPLLKPKAQSGCQLHDWQQSIEEKKSIPTLRTPVEGGVTKLRMNQNYIVSVRLTSIDSESAFSAINSVSVDGNCLILAEKLQFDADEDEKKDFDQITARVVFPLVDLSNTGQFHDFVNKMAILPTWCQWCGGYIFGLIPPNAKSCWYCGYVVHPRCAIEAINNCPEEHADEEQAEIDPALLNIQTHYRRAKVENADQNQNRNQDESSGDDIDNEDYGYGYDYVDVEVVVNADEADKYLQGQGMDDASSLNGSDLAPLANLGLDDENEARGSIIVTKKVMVRRKAKKTQPRIGRRELMEKNMDKRRSQRMHNLDAAAEYRAQKQREAEEKAAREKEKKEAEEREEKE